jgi:hypothetical protein
MIIEMFLTSSLLPALCAGLLALALSFLGGWKRDLIQGALFAGAFFFGFYRIQGGVGNFQSAGMEALVVLPVLLWLSLFFLRRPGFDSLWRLVLSVGFVVLLAWPLLKGVSSFLSLQTLQGRILISFTLMTFVLWSFMERRLQGEWWAASLSAALVSSAAAALYFLFEGSASLSQVFGVMATFSGVLLGISLVFDGRFSGRAVAVYLGTLVVLILMTGALYMDLKPLSLLVLCLPYAVAALRPFIPVARGGVIKEVLLTGLPGALSVSWLIYQSYIHSGPLY